MRSALSAFLAIVLVLPLVAAPAPEVSHSHRGIESQTVAGGEPIFFVAIRIEVPEDCAAAIKLRHASGTWAAAGNRPKETEKVNRAVAQRLAADAIPPRKL